MKAHPTTLRVVLVDPPTEFDGMADVEPFVEEKARNVPGERRGSDVVFETRYSEIPPMGGPAIRREKDGRWFVYVAWYGTKEGVWTRFRRLKVHLDRVPELIHDCEVTVAGRGRDGSPACATATILGARNVEDYLPTIVD